jgi:hypothetical protein
MSKFIFLFFLILFSLCLFAHRGGHYHQADEPNLHHWGITQNGKQIVGNFSNFKEQQIFVEGVHGIKYTLEYCQLNKSDKAYVDRYISKINALNYSIPFKTKIPVKNNHSFSTSYIYIGIFLVILALVFWKWDQLVSPKFSIGIIVSVCIGFIIMACGKDAVLNSNTPTTFVNDTAFLRSIFEPFKSSGVSTRYDGTYFYVESNGIPTHNMMVGITSWQQQVPVPQPYTGSNAWPIPLKPEMATNPLSLKTNLMKGAVAIASNGVPIFNPLNNRGDDAYLFGELDNWGGHCGKADDYHYHIAPLHLQSTMVNKPIAVALDGFMIYGNKEPDGLPMQSLDAYNGHTYSSSYHYHGTSTYPYIMGSMRGKVSIDSLSSAPENQITPQALTTAFRPAGSPLNGATITAFSQTGVNAFLLEYKINNKTGTVNYSWDSNKKYTFIFKDTAGVTTTSVYQR